MSDIRIRRAHAFGLPQARRMAQRWAEEATQKFDLQCTVTEGETADTVDFKRSGVSGRLVVAADHFELVARLGMLLGAFRGKIEAEIEKNLDALLASGPPSAHA